MTVWAENPWADAAAHPHPPAHPPAAHLPAHPLAADPHALDPGSTRIVQLEDTIDKLNLTIKALERRVIALEQSGQ